MDDLTTETGTADTPGAPAASGEDDRLERDRRKVRRLSTLLDSQFRVPGTGIRFGVDAILGLIPGVGDAVGIVASGAVIVQAVDLGARGATLARMLLNAVLDGVFGTVPVVGTVFDVAYKANDRNVRLLERHVTDADATSRASKRALVLTAAAVVTVLFVAAALVIGLVAALVTWIL